MGSLPMDNHFSKTTNNHPSDGHLSYKKKVPIAIDTAKVRVVRHREGSPVFFFYTVAQSDKNDYLCADKTKPDSLIYSGYRDSTLQR